MYFAAAEAIENVHLLGRNPAQSQDAPFQLHNLFENRIVGAPERKDIVFELINALVKVVEDRRIIIDYLIENLVQQKRRPTLAAYRTGGQLFLDVVDAAKHFVVISDDVVRTEETIQLDGVEAI